MVHCIDDDKKLHSFFVSGKTFFFSKGEVILSPNDSADGIYFIEKGFIKVYWISETGDEKLHVIYKPGEIFPLLWALNDVPIGGYYEAMSEVACRKVRKDEFIKFILSKPQELLALTAKLANNFKIYVHMIDNLEITKSYPRLISKLLFLAKRFGREEKDMIILDVPITHKDIASSITSTRETISRDLLILEKKHLIGRKDQNIVIYNIQKLENEFLDFYSSS